MDLRTRNLPSWRLKNDFGEINEAMFQGVEGPYELIFYILGIQKKTIYTR
jgi:hypothetical protein